MSCQLVLVISKEPSNFDIGTLYHVHIFVPIFSDTKMLYVFLLKFWLRRCEEEKEEDLIKATASKQTVFLDCIKTTELPHYFLSNSLRLGLYAHGLPLPAKYTLRLI